MGTSFSIEKAKQEKLFYVVVTGIIYRADDARCLKFACRYVSGDVRIPPEFDEFAWVNADEARERDCIMGIPEEVERTIEIFLS